eukprot:CAMPEP_0114625828 /NCGR_PEP_ID=MMETSP0168-20121206/11466_1 /TAXON_ID=95228 ORGANISM="Vannella sp., Strain DIVA3 517/6/12" /NCGR_SAMPLE_ID=MMETSP0168 /ASSEMBLY_ACC=CAM_ASM_000044 /LENGTH=383 /DNA_ID=CAMNT_0001837111 /DNA_START=36 /DNA_END=1187 /DNA_ORIENTATION=+
MEETWTAGQFSVLPVTVASRVGEAEQVRMVYYRQHKGPASSEGADRTLFVTNLPPGCTADEAVRLFADAFGPVKSVTCGVMRGSAVSSSLGKRKTREQQLRVSKPDYNQNTNVGLSFASDDTVRYNRINAVTPHGTSSRVADLATQRALASIANTGRPPAEPEAAVEVRQLGASGKGEAVRFLAGSFMHLVFEKKKSLAKALAATSGELDELSLRCVVGVAGVESDEDGDLEMEDAEKDSGEAKAVATCGFGLWMAQHKDAVVDKEELLREVDEAMVEFDKQQREAAKQEEAQSNVMDEDGFIMVRPRKKRHTDGGQTQVQGVKASALRLDAQKKKKSKVLQDFYRFQKHERQRDRIADLRKKFEEDKEKIARMKASRKFRPF